MGGFFGTSNQTTSTSQSPPPQIQADYQGLINRATAVANTPYTPYPGEQVAPLSNQTQAGLANMDQYAYAAQPYLNQAGQMVNAGYGMQNQAGQYQSQGAGMQALAGAYQQQGAGMQALAGQTNQQGAGLVNQGAGMLPQAGNMTLAAAGPVSAQQFSGSAVNQYESPYTQDVINATQNQFNNQNTQQAQFLNSQNIGAGAFGGDRAGISQAVLAGQQQASQAPVIAGLNQANYNQALSEFNNQQQTNLGTSEFNQQQLGQMGAQYGNLGSQLGTMGTQLGNIGTQYGGIGNNLSNIGSQYGTTGTNLGTIGTQYGATGLNEANIGNAYGNIGTQTQAAGTSGANDQIQAGMLPQDEQQAIDNSLLNTWNAGQAYPYQSTGFLQNVIEGIGSNSGGSGATTTPQGSLGSQIAGVATAGLGALGNFAGTSAGSAAIAGMLPMIGLARGGRAGGDRENVTSVGETFDGQPIHRFNYRGDPRQHYDAGGVAPGSVYDLGVGKGFSPSGALGLMNPGTSLGAGADTGTGRFGAGSLSMTPGGTLFKQGEAPVSGPVLPPGSAPSPSPMNPLPSGPYRQAKAPYQAGQRPVAAQRLPSPPVQSLGLGGRINRDIGGPTGLGNVQMTGIGNTGFIDFSTPTAIAQGTGVPLPYAGIPNILFSSAAGGTGQTGGQFGAEGLTQVGSTNLAPSQPNLSGAAPGTVFKPIDYQDPLHNFQTAGAEGGLGPHNFTKGANGELVYGGEGTAPADTTGVIFKWDLLPRPCGYLHTVTPKTENPPPAAPPPAATPPPTASTPPVADGRDPSLDDTSGQFFSVNNYDQMSGKCVDAHGRVVNSATGGRIGRSDVGGLGNPSKYTTTSGYTRGATNQPPIPSPTPTQSPVAIRSADHSPCRATPRSRHASSAAATG